MALPFFFAYLGSYSITFVGMWYAGAFSVAEASGFGLAIMITNALGYSVVSGLAGGLDPLISQTYGVDPEHPKILAFAQRGIICFSLFLIPIGIAFYTAGTWLSWLHFGEPAVIELAAPQIRLCILALPAWLLWDVLQCVLACCDAVKETCFGYLVAAAVNPIVLHFFVEYHHLGYDGLMASYVIVSWVMVISASFYTFYVTKRLDGIVLSGGGTWQWEEAMTHWKPLLRRALPSMCILLCVWTASELNVLLSSLVLPTAQFDAAAICQQIILVAYSLPSALSYAVVCKVGNFLGANDMASVKRTMWIGVVLTTLWAAFVAVSLVGFRAKIATAFSPHDDVQDAVIDAIPSLCVFFFVDTLLGAIASGLRGIGVPSRVAWSAFVGWSVGLSLTYYFSRSHPQWGLSAFYDGPAVGLLAACVMCAYFLATTSWEVQEDIVQELLADPKRKRE